MTNFISILNPITYAELAKIKNVINPLISEQINDVYNFEFETIYDEVSKFATGGNIIEVDDDYFRIATTTKDINSNYRVFAEHVSFALSMAYFDDYTADGVDGTAEEILRPMLDQIGWGITFIAPTEIKYFKPSPGDSVRKQIIAVADLFGLEIIWNKFSVSLVEKQGNQEPIPFKLGENLLAVTETYDLTQEKPEPTLDVDVLDLSQLEGYENFRKIGLGDAVNVIAPHIDINATSRVVYRQYNPFTKTSANVQIGRVMRDFTTYIRDEKEDEEEASKELWLEAFSIDDIDILKIDGIDSTDVGSALDVDLDAIPKKIVITAKQQYANYYIAVNIEENGKSIAFILNDEFTNGSATIENVFTKDFLYGAVNVSLSDKPYNTEGAIVRSYFVDLNIKNPVDNYLLEYFEIDNDDVLSLPGIDTQAGAIHTIYGQVQKVSMKLKYGEVFDDVKVEFFDGEESSGVYTQSHFKNGVLIVNTRFHSYSKGMRIKVTLKQGEKNHVYVVRCEMEKDTPMGVSYYIESETVKVGSGGAVFNFTVPYDAVVSVVPGVGKVEQEETVTAHCSLIEDESGMFTGVSVEVKGLKASEVDVSVQAVCQEGVEEGAEPIV